MPRLSRSTRAPYRWAGFVSTSGSTHWSRTRVSGGSVHRGPRVLHAREDAEENARAERLADPDACATEPRDFSVSDEDLLMLNPGLRRLARDDIVLEPVAFLGHRS